MDMLSINNNLLHEKLYCFNKTNIRELGPSIQNVKETIFEEDLSIVVDDLINHIFKEVNEGREAMRKKQFFDYINNHKISSREIYIWLLNNQTNSNSIYLLGYFNYRGIEINVNKQKGIELYQKAAVELENSVAQFDLAYICIRGKDVEKNYNLAFELANKLAEKEYLPGINMLGYCYDYGVGTDVNQEKAFELSKVSRFRKFTRDK